MRKLRAFQNWHKICEHWAFQNLNLQHFGSKLTRKRLKTELFNIKHWNKNISKSKLTRKRMDWTRSLDHLDRDWGLRRLWGWFFLPPVHLHCEVFTTSSAHLRRSHAGFTSSAYLRRLWGWFLTEMHIWEQGFSTPPVIQHYNRGAPPANSFLWWG